MRMNRSIYAIAVAIAVLGLLSQNAVTAQGPPDQPDLTIDAATRSSVIDAALTNLNNYYVFPEVAKKMETAVKERVGRKEYDQITSAKALAAALKIIYKT